MSDRVLFGNNGSQFVARVTKPGYDVSSSDLSHFSMHESFTTLIPIAKGTVVLGVGASTGFTASAMIGKCPFVVLKSAEGILPVSPTPGFAKGSFFMRVNPATGACSLYNEYASTLTITYAVFIAP
tara:strand:+ start:2138 stop:2515 length:378 start_codon:yes stop_codon:yes gene_type:complete